MTESTFVRLVKAVIEQVEIDNKRMFDLEKAFGPDNYIFIQNDLMDALADELSQYSTLDEDLFFNFLYSKKDICDGDIIEIYKGE